VRAPSASPEPQQQRRRHAWVIGGLGMECAATGEAGKYLGQAQWAMRRCLEAAAAAAVQQQQQQQQQQAFPLVLYEEVKEEGGKKGEKKQEALEEAAAAATTTTTAAPSDYTRWPLVAALPGVGQARRSPRGDLAVALVAAAAAPAANDGEGAVVLTLILNADATQLLVLPDGARYALPGLTDVATGALMPKAVRGLMRPLHRVLGAVETGLCGK